MIDEPETVRNERVAAALEGITLALVDRLSLELPWRDQVNTPEAILDIESYCLFVNFALNRAIRSSGVLNDVSLLLVLEERERAHLDEAFSKLDLKPGVTDQSFRVWFERLLAYRNASVTGEYEAVAPRVAREFTRFLTSDQKVNEAAAELVSQLLLRLTAAHARALEMLEDTVKRDGDSGLADPAVLDAIVDVAYAASETNNSTRGRMPDYPQEYLDFSMAAALRMSDLRRQIEALWQATQETATEVEGTLTFEPTREWDWDGLCERSRELAGAIGVLSTYVINWHIKHDWRGDPSQYLAGAWESLWEATTEMSGTLLGLISSYAGAAKRRPRYSDKDIEGLFLAATTVEEAWSTVSLLYKKMVGIETAADVSDWDRRHSSQDDLPF